jgi:hypothetical protein
MVQKNFHVVTYLECGQLSQEVEHEDMIHVWRKNTVYLSSSIMPRVTRYEVVQFGSTHVWSVDLALV